MFSLHLQHHINDIFLHPSLTCRPCTPRALSVTPPTPRARLLPPPTPRARLLPPYTQSSPPISLQILPILSPPQKFICYSTTPRALPVTPLHPALGRCWNTRIVIFDQMTMVQSGPYRYLRHPNYLAVVLEIAAIPALVGAWYTALLFSIANGALLLLIRIPAEERAMNKRRT